MNSKYIIIITLLSALVIFAGCEPIPEWNRNVQTPVLLDPLDDELEVIERDKNFFESLQVLKRKYNSAMTDLCDLVEEKHGQQWTGQPTTAPRSF